MKKLNYFLLGAAGLVLASCANEDLTGPGNPDGTANVTVNLSTPEINSRAYSNGMTATQLQYAVYMKNGNTLTLLPSYTHDSTNAEEIQLKKQVSFQLVNGNTYTFVFWAGNSEAPYTIEFAQNGATMTVNYDGILANTEELDAFYTHIEHTVNGDASVEAHLLRPFAQINVGTNDYAAAEAAGYTPTVSQIKVNNLYTTLNLLTDEVDDDTSTSVTFDYKEFDTTEDFPVKQLDEAGKNKLQYMAMTYGLVAADQANVEVYFDVKDGNEVVRGEHTVGSVPVRRNYRTNIYGALLTSQLDVNVVIEPAFEIPDFEFNVIAPGVQYDEESETFTISSAEGLQWFSSQVNSQGGNPAVKTETFSGYSSAKASFVGQTIVLENDIDMSGIDWTPIGYETNSSGASIYGFAGTFDGNNKTISNLKVRTEKDNNAGFFGTTRQAVIKDLTLKDVDILGHYKTGAIVGDGVNVKIENCHVIGGSVVSTPWEKTPGTWDDANNVGGIVGYLNGQPNVSWVKNSTVDKLRITAFRKVGGIAGVVTAADDTNNGFTCGVEIEGCTVTNSIITAAQTESRYDNWASRDFDSGAIYGWNGTPAKFTSQVKLQENTAGSDVTIENIKPNKIANSPEELKNLLQTAEEGDYIVLNEGTYPTSFDYDGNKTLKTENITIDCNGATLTGVSKLCLNATAVVKNANFLNDSGDAVYGNIAGTFEDCTFISTTKAGQHVGYANSDVTFNRCYFEGANYHATHFDGGNNRTITYNDCEFNGFCAWDTSSNVVMNGCLFTVNETSQYGGGNFWGSANITDCDFNIFEQSATGNFVRVYNPAKTYIFTNCRKNGRTFTHDMLRVNEDGVTVTVDGVEKVLNQK